MEELWQLLARGGVLMAPILVASVVSVTVFLERLWSLRSARVFPPRFAILIYQKVSAGEIEAARTLCEGSPTPVARVIAAGLRSAGRSREALKTAFEEIGRVEVNHLGRYLEILGTIATVTPLLGLLGTVVGMIDVFRAVVSEAGGGAVNPASLANGIWSALLTTAAGLSAAIPAFIAYKILLARVDRIASELEELSLALLDQLCPPTRGLRSSSERVTFSSSPPAASCGTLPPPEAGASDLEREEEIESLEDKGIS